MEQVQIIELKKQELLNVANTIYEVTNSNSKSILRSYYYKNAANEKIPLLIDQSGTEAFALSDRMKCITIDRDSTIQNASDDMRNTGSVIQLVNQIFLMLYIIHKAAVTKASKFGVYDIRTPIVIDLIDNETSDIIINLAAKETDANPINIFDYLTAEMYNSLNLFGIYIKRDLMDRKYAPVQLGFNIVSDINNIQSIAAVGNLYVYVDNILTSSESIRWWNSSHKQDHIRIINSIIQSAEVFEEGIQNVTSLSNKTTHGLLKSIGDKYDSEPFSAIAELYSLLGNSGKDIYINYPDFASSSFSTLNSQSQLTDGQLRALALFHLQNPNITINFVGATNKVESDFCKYVADLADRVEGTLSDRLIALSKKELGKLYCIEANAGRHLMAILDDVFLHNNINTFQVLAIPVDSLITILSYSENRINVCSDDKTDMFIPLHYDEDPFDYRPDFKLNPLTVKPVLSNIALIQNIFKIEQTGADVKILDVLQTLLMSRIFNPFAKAELAEFADFSVTYDSKSGYIGFDEEDAESLILLKHFPDCNKKLPNLIRDKQQEFLDENMPRSLSEKLFIAKCLIHRILRYFEIHLYKYNASRRLLSLADLVCFESEGKKYIGIGLNKLKPTFKVTPLLSPFSIQNAQKVTTEISGSGVLQFKARNVSRVIPTSIFLTFDSLPVAIAEIVKYLNIQNSCNKEYKDYISYGYKFPDYLTEYLILYSCSHSQAAIITDIDNSDYYASLKKGYINAIHSAKIESKLGIIERQEYETILQHNSLQYLISNLTAQLYNIYNYKERELIASKEDLFDSIDFNFFKSVRLQYSPLTIFGTWNTSADTVVWHTTLLKD